jgi:hypothetical protein
MKWYWATLLVLVVILIAVSIHIKKPNTNNYKQARQMADTVKRKLLIIGDPKRYSMSDTDDLNYGDICIDMDPISTNGKCQKARTPDYLKKLPPNSYVILVNNVLEFTEDIGGAYTQMVRVAGSPDLIFVNMDNKINPKYLPKTIQ